jgi:Spy/CpxP family protein refolding chaperone
MRLAHFHFVRAAIVALCLAVGAAAAAQAQGGGRGGGPPGGGGGPGHGGMGGGGMSGGMGDQNRSGFPGGGSRPGLSPESIPSRNSNVESPARAGLQLGPPGQRWWDDRGFVKSLKLRPDQQARMDAIFEQNRNLLVSRFEGLQQAQAQMEQLSSSSSPDESALYAQIDRVAQARADLEKANTHLLLQLRSQMDADQIKRLENSR